jgi:phenylacetate-CoA ligase
MAKKVWDPKMECMDPRKMKMLQKNRFISLVRWSYEKSPFYRKKYDQAGIHPEDIRSLADIARIPFIYKDDLRASQEAKSPYGEHCIQPEKIFRTYWSTGTTGRPTFMGVSYKEALYWDRVIARSLYSCGLRKGDLFHHATQLSSFAGGFSFLVAAQLIGANIIPAGAGNTERHIQLIAKLKPGFLKILPSYANYVAEVAYKMGIDLSASSVNRIFLSAEPSPPALRQEIERKWGATTYDSYGLSDIGQPQAYECNRRDGLHDIPDWNFTEIIDPETKEPIHEIGKEGVLVYTNLVRKDMPIIRFWTNNPTAWKSFDPCACGRTSARIFPICRRVDDTIKVKGVNFWPSAIWTILSDQPELAGTHQIVVETRGGKDYLKIIAECKEGVAAETETLDNTLKNKFQSSLFIRVDEVEILPFGSLETGEHKAKTLLDLRHPA